MKLVRQISNVLTSKFYYKNVSPNPIIHFTYLDFLSVYLPTNKKHAIKNLKIQNNIYAEFTHHENEFGFPLERWFESTLVSTTNKFSAYDFLSKAGTFSSYEFQGIPNNPILDLSQIDIIDSRINPINRLQINNPSKTNLNNNFSNTISKNIISTTNLKLESLSAIWSKSFYQMYDFNLFNLSIDSKESEAFTIFPIINKIDMINGSDSLPFFTGEENRVELQTYINFQIESEDF